MLLTIEQNQTSYSVEEDGSILVRSLDAPMNQSRLLSWLDLPLDVQTAILGIAQEKGVYISVNRAVWQFAIRATLSQPKGTISEGRRVDDTPSRYDVVPLGHDPSATRW